MKLTNLRKKMNYLLKESKWLFEDEDSYEEKVEDEIKDAEDSEEIQENDLEDISFSATEDLKAEKERIADEAFKKLTDKTVIVNDDGKEFSVTITKAYWGADDVLMFSGESVDPETGHKSLHTLI